MEEALIYSHVSVCYGRHEVVRDVSFTLGRGEILAIVGESGSGKSTLLKAAMGLLGESGCVTRGDIYYPADESDGSLSSDGRLPYIDLPDCEEARMRQIRGTHLAMIFQDPGAGFCPVRRILDLFYEEGRAHGLYKAGRREKDRCRREGAALLAKLGLKEPEEILAGYPFELSGGMLQRVAIAMALMLQPQVMMADEPTSALDVYSQKLVAQELQHIRAQYGTSILLVTHNIGLARYAADRILVLRDGKKVEEGDRDRVLQHPKDPYTKELLAAVPRLRDAGTVLQQPAAQGPAEGASHG